MSGYDPGGKNKRDLGNLVYPKTASYVDLTHKLTRAEEPPNQTVREVKSFHRKKRSAKITGL